MISLRPHLTILTPLLLSFSLSACSLYKSQGRKQFETDAGNAKLTTSFVLESCKRQSALAAWLQSEFPNRSYELITAENDLEIWKLNHTDGAKDESVEIHAIQIESSGRSLCTYRFANESTWQRYRASFIEELSNNLMTND